MNKTLCRYKPATILGWVLAEPQTPVRELAARRGVDFDVFMARLETARLQRAKMRGPVISHAGAVSLFEFDAPEGWGQWFLFQADNHHDSIYCNRAMEERHLQEAMKRDAQIMIFGDLLDAMQGKFDKRSSYDELRTEYKKQDYYSEIADNTAKWLTPYSDNIALIADGNHELSVLNNHNIDILRLVIGQLNAAGSAIHHGGYGGWCLLKFDLGEGHTVTRRIKYFHGSGGEAPVTRGAIQTNRQAVYLPDADIVVNGHSHNAYYIPIARERLEDDGTLRFDLQHHIRVPGYKQGYGDGSKGWEVTRGGVPKPIGAAWVYLYREGNDIKTSVQLDISGADPVSLEPELFTGKVFAQDTEYP